MIDLSSMSKEAPYVRFSSEYNEASILDQPNIEAVCISSFDVKKSEPDSRFVNLKNITDNEWIFFTNYNSPKAKQFESIDNISASFFWHKTNCQIRIKAVIKKTSPKYSDDYFKSRHRSKNLLAIASDQSNAISSYEDFLSKYENIKERDIDLSLRPDYWGGYTFTPYYFEFWKGHESRLNKREIFTITDNVWTSSFLQP